MGSLYFDASYILKGLIIGIMIAAPVGPIGVLCVRRTIAEGRAYGLVSGLGAATADGVYGFIAAFGLTFISSFLVTEQLWIRVIGGLFLCLLGVKALLSKPQETPSSPKDVNLLRAYVSTLFLTFTNPMTIISFAAIFAAVGLSNVKGDYFSATVLVLSVFAGSSLWWLFLTYGISRFREKFDSRGLTWVNRISGLVIIVFGFTVLISVILAKYFSPDIVNLPK